MTTETVFLHLGYLLHDSTSLWGCFTLITLMVAVLAFLLPVAVRKNSTILKQSLAFLSQNLCNSIQKTMNLTRHNAEQFPCTA